MEIYLAAKTQLLAKRWAENLHCVSIGEDLGLSTAVLRHHIVLTQSFPMNRYLQNFASNNGGIAMGLFWTKPWSLIKTLHSLFLQQSDSIEPPLLLEDPFSKDALRLRIARILVAAANSPTANALNQKGSGSFRLAAKKLLAARIQNTQTPTQSETIQQALAFAAGLASSFDQYFVYRPEFFKKWENSPPRWKNSTANHGEKPQMADNIEIENFQHELWKILKAEIVAEVANTRLASKSAFSRTEQMQQLLELLQAKNTDAVRQKFFTHFSHLSVFGVSNLPPSMLEILEALDNALQQGDKNQASAISFFLLNCDQPDSNDQLSNPVEHDKNYKDKDFFGESLTAQFSYFFSQLRSLSKKQGREQNTVVKMIEAAQKDPANLLTAVKNYFSALKPPHFHQTMPKTLTCDKTGMAIMQCRDREQEVHVLANTILTLLKSRSDSNEGEKLAVNDVLVMAPLVSDYAHLIRTVFALYGLPFSITDESIPNTKPILVELHRLLLLFSEEITPKSIVDVVEGEYFSQKQGIQPHIDTIKNAIEKFFIRSPHRDSLFSHQSAVNSFSSGLARMLQSYSAYKYSDHEKVPDKTAEALAIFFDTVAQLENMRKRLLNTRSIEAWCDCCQELVSQFLGHNNDRDDGVFELLHTLRTAAIQGGWGNQPLELSLPQFRFLLEEKLSETTNERGFMVGRITVSSLLPMRSIPFRAIYLLGMDEISFPRYTQHSQLSLVSRKPRASDPKKELEDQQILVESIVSALDYWFISFSIYQEKKGAPQRRITPLMYDIFEKSSKSWSIAEKPLSTSKLLEQITVDHSDDIQDDTKEQQSEAENAKKVWKNEYSTLQRKLAATTASIRQNPSKQYRYSYIDEESLLQTFSPKRMENNSLEEQNGFEKVNLPVERIKLDELIGFFTDPIKKIFEREGVSTRSAYRSTFHEHEPLEKYQHRSGVNDTFEGDYTDKNLIRSYLKDPKFFRTPKLDWEDEAIKKQLPYGLAGKAAVKEINAVLEGVWEKIELLLSSKKIGVALPEQLTPLAGHLFLEKTCSIQLQNCSVLVNGVVGPLLSPQCFVVPFYEKTPPHFPSWASIANWLLQTLFLFCPTTQQRWHNSWFSNDLPAHKALEGNFFSAIVGVDNKLKKSIELSAKLEFPLPQNVTEKDANQASSSKAVGLLKPFIEIYLAHNTALPTALHSNAKLDANGHKFDLPPILPLFGKSAVKYLMNSMPTQDQAEREKWESHFHNEWREELEQFPQQWFTNLSSKHQESLYKKTRLLYQHLFDPLVDPLDGIF